MLLPQGEFARFLRASDDDRRELLTKLFGTQLYDRITAELDPRAEATRPREQADRAIAPRWPPRPRRAGGGRGGPRGAASLPRADRRPG